MYLYLYICISLYIYIYMLIYALCFKCPWIFCLMAESHQLDRKTLRRTLVPPTMT